MARTIFAGVTEAVASGATLSVSTLNCGGQLNLAGELALPSRNWTVAAGTTETVGSGTRKTGDTVHLAGQLNVAGQAEVGEPALEAADGTGSATGTALDTQGILPTAAGVGTSLVMALSTRQEIVQPPAEATGTLTATATAAPDLAAAGAGAGTATGGAIDTLGILPLAAGVGRGVGAASKILEAPLWRVSDASVTYDDTDEYDITYDDTDEYTLE